MLLETPIERQACPVLSSWSEVCLDLPLVENQSCEVPVCHLQLLSVPGNLLPRPQHAHFPLFSKETPGADRKAAAFTNWISKYVDFTESEGTPSMESHQVKVMADELW